MRKVCRQITPSLNAFLATPGTSGRREEVKTALVPPDNVDSAIFVLRGVNVILDSDLASLYGVTTARFNEQVRRNAERSPSDFMFQFTQDDYEARQAPKVFSPGFHRAWRNHGGVSIELSKPSR